MKLACAYCQCSFERTKRRRFCSRDCFHMWSRGKINKGPKTSEHRLKLSKVQRGKPHLSEAFLSPERGKKISAARMGMKFSDSHRQALSEAKVRFLESGGFHGRQSEYVSLKTGECNWAHSEFERELMKQLDTSDLVVRWSKNHGIKIPYEYKGARNYVPDFLVETRDGLVIVMEAKGYEFEPERCLAKAQAAHDFCQSRGWIYQMISQKSGVVEA